MEIEILGKDPSLLLSSPFVSVHVYLPSILLLLLLFSLPISLILATPRLSYQSLRWHLPDLLPQLRLLQSSYSYSSA